MPRHISTVIKHPAIYIISAVALIIFGILFSNIDIIDISGVEAFPYQGTILRKEVIVERAGRNRGYQSCYLMLSVNQGHDIGNVFTPCTELHNYQIDEKLKITGARGRLTGRLKMIMY